MTTIQIENALLLRIIVNSVLPWRELTFRVSIIYWDTGFPLMSLSLTVRRPYPSHAT